MFWVCFQHSADDRSPSSRLKEHNRQQMTHLGRFQHDSVGKWEMKHDKLLMFLPTPRFQEYEKNTVIAKEIICHRAAGKTWGKSHSNVKYYVLIYRPSFSEWN